ncbi:MAG: hypothetical protein HYS81_04330 [Candidatus Aenigmatarchaeota archaeon]|nr:MAG: hypothetical protein HYS81_04330 [Candidatus Aenigmarchaeota archaeon]
MTNYRKGVRFEYRVRDIFRRHGYAAERKAASSPYDIMVMKGGRVVFVVDAKKTSVSGKKHIHISRDDVSKIISNASVLNAQPLVVYGFNMGDAFVAFPEELLKNDGKTVRLEDGMLLEKFLQSYIQAA